MLKNKFIKISVVALLLVTAMWIAIPKVYIRNLLHQNRSTLNVNTETKLQSQSDEELKGYNQPVYFNIFKFISSFMPMKP